MKIPRFLSGHTCRVFVLVGFGCCLWLSPTRAELPPRPGNEYQPTNGEFAVFGQAVVELLKSRSVDGLATNYAVTSGDWQSVLTTNLAKADADRINEYAKGANYNLQRLQAGAQSLLNRADSLHLDFSGDNLGYQVVAPKFVGKVILSRSVAEELTLPHVDSLDVILLRGSESNRPGAGEFKVTLRGLEKFPTGWRMNNGNNSIQWTGFPTNVADPTLLRELAMSEKMAAFAPITSQDDPTLLKLGESLVRFLRAGDTNAFKNDLLLNSDILWGVFQKSGRPGPSRQELDQEVGKMVQEQLAVVTKMLESMNTAGIDLKTADIQIKDARLDHCRSQGEAGSLDQLAGEQFSLSLAVKTDARARNGTSLAGDYVLGVKQIMKLGGGWKVEQDMHWEKLPTGIVDADTAAKIAFENYVAKNRALPADTAAPEIEFSTLMGEKKMKLSDLRGKVVVLDFWATWCGPCQSPLANLQTIRNGHPDWQDKVAIVPVSIDDTLDLARQHVNQRGWTNTFNVWAGEGGWHSETAKTFRVTSVPTSYVIDPQGKIVRSGFPELEEIANTVEQQLGK